MSMRVDFGKLPFLPATNRFFQLSPVGGNATNHGSPAQFEPDAPGSRSGTLRWFVSARSTGTTRWALETCEDCSGPILQVTPDSATGRWDVSESGRPVLRYNYGTNEPGQVLERVSQDNRKYARARGDYIHPLYGLDGEELTRDWSVDHPHHRGIYWAWPEVDYQGERGDLHALQRVFARPTGHCTGEGGPVFARIEAENLWLWEDRDPIVRERAVIRAWRQGSRERMIDLEFTFTALKDGVAVARRETRLYGGLNIRLAPVTDQEVRFFTSSIGAVPRQAWAELSGVFSTGKSVAGLTVFQNPANPNYPGDWVKYPELNWFQPTFPAAGTRFVLKKDQPLVLKYRLWIHSGRSTESDSAERWTDYAYPPSATLTP
jgi:hypothetical protein